MRMMVRTKQPLCQSDINVLRDFAQRLDRHEGKRVLAKSYEGPGKFVFP